MIANRRAKQHPRELGIGFRRDATLIVVLVLATTIGVLESVGPAGTARAASISNQPTTDRPSAAHVTVAAHSRRIWTSDNGTARAIFIARFTNAHGEPERNLPVSWSTTGGTLSTTSGRTDPMGQAHVTLTQPSKISPSKEVAVVAADAKNRSVSSYSGVEFIQNNIPVYPKSSARGPWEWNATCPFVPSATIPPAKTSRCARTDPVFGPVVVNGDLWNLASSAKGAVTMRDGTDGALHMSADFRTTPATNPSSWVLGYPNISYGIAPQAVSGSPHPSTSLPLPMAVSSLPKDVIATTSYKLSGTTTAKYDFAYDIWLEPQAAVKTPRAGTLEIMVWTANGNDSLPPGYKETDRMNFALDGVTQAGRWGLYVANGAESFGASTTVELVLTRSISSGKVAVDLSSVFRTVGSALKRYEPAHWSTLSNYYLDNICLGSEFGRKNGASRLGPFSWNLNGYGLELGKKLP